MITNTQVLLDVLPPFQPALFGKPGTIHYSSVGNNTSFLEPGRMYIIPCDQFLTFPEKSRAAAFICYGDSSVFRPELAPKTSSQPNSSPSGKPSKPSYSAPTNIWTSRTRCTPLPCPAKI